jgi:hypothetical protein
MLWFSVLLVLLGLVQITLHKKIARWLYGVQRPWFKTAYSWLVDVDARWFRKSYDIAMLLMGIMFLIGAYAIYFGPITL